MTRAGPISLDAKVAFLRNPGSYPGRVRAVSAIETHFAWVFLAARHAYKLKKPLRHGAMDYRALAAREQGCREELRLNRRLAPGVYLSVVPLVRRNGELALVGQDGEIVDWLVRMRRLPAARMLDRILARRTLTSGELDRVVRVLARFFAAAEPEPMVGVRYVARLALEILDNRRALRRAGRRAIQKRAEDVARVQRLCLRRGRGLIASRSAHLVEGHGDLRAEHVCLAAPVSVIDCLEFSRELRRLDPIEELAFLSLEIERLGHPALAAELVGRFCAATRDDAARAIVSFYRSHRAATRAKLAVWHLGDPQFPDSRPWLARADSYLRDARRHALEAFRILDVERSARVGGRPALEQRRDRRATRHPRDRRPEQRRDRQDRHAAGA
jgi:aminoglycoside phosphotransferase family enzyme